MQSGSQRRAKLIMGQFIGCIDASNTLISNKNICRIHHGSIRSRDFPDCLHNIERHIKQLPVIQNPAGKMLPSGNSDPASAFQSGLLKTVRETAFAGHRLIGQGKKRNMNSLGFDPGTGYFIQVFIAPSAWHDARLCSKPAAPPQILEGIP